jgi:hypothetical protein
MPARKNPRSLVNVLRSIRKNFSGNDISLKEFTEQIAKINFEYQTNPLSLSQISKIENNGSHIAFWQIEMYAKFIGVPSAFILLLSRMSSEFKALKREFPEGHRDRTEEMHRRFADITKLARQFRDVCDYIESHVWDIYHHTRTDEEVLLLEKKTLGGVDPDILSRMYQIFCEGRILTPEEIHTLLPINKMRRMSQPFPDPAGDSKQLEFFQPSDVLSRRADGS